MVTARIRPANRSARVTPYTTLRTIRGNAKKGRIEVSDVGQHVGKKCVRSCRLDEPSPRCREAYIGSPVEK